MIINICDNCGKEVKELDSISEDGFKTLEVCKICEVLISKEMAKVTAEVEKSRLKVVNRYLNKENKKSHKHRFSGGYILRYEGKAELIKICQEVGCRKRKVELVTA